MDILEDIVQDSRQGIRQSSRAALAGAVFAAVLFAAPEAQAADHPPMPVLENPGKKVEGQRIVVRMRFPASEWKSVYQEDPWPYYVRVDGKPFLILPYTLETNDIRFWAGGGFSTADDFFSYMRDALDTLWEEGVETPKMMSVGLHMRIIGRPGRAPALDKFLAYARAKGGVWITRRVDIAKVWTAQHPPPG